MNGQLDRVIHDPILIDYFLLSQLDLYQNFIVIFVIFYQIFQQFETVISNGGHGIRCVGFLLFILKRLASLDMREILQNNLYF